MVAASILNHHHQPDNPACSCSGVEQLWTLQTIDGPGPTASNTVLPAVPIEIMELLERVAKMPEDSSASCLPGTPALTRHRPANHDRRSSSQAVRRLYAGPAGGVLRTLSCLSMHVPLSESWLRDRVFDLRGAKRILDAGCGAGQLTGHLEKYADSDASITACDLSVKC